MKIHGVNHILMDRKEKSLEIRSLDNDNLVKNRKNDQLKIIKTIVLPNAFLINRTVNGFVQSNINSHITIDTESGLIKILSPENLIMNQHLIVNQNISIGIYDVADRAALFKLQITVPGIVEVDDQIYQFLVKKDSINYQLLQNDDVVEANQNNISQRLYQLVVVDDSENKLNINLELNGGGIDKAFLRGNDIYLTINDRLYRVIGEVPNLKNILNSGPASVTLVIREEFNLKENLIHLLDKITQSLPVQTLVEVVSLIGQSTPAQIPPNYLEAYKSVFAPFFSKFRSAKLQIRESRGSCKNLRLIFELASEDGSFSLIDCLYLSSANSLNVVVRSDHELSLESKARFTASFNRIASEMLLIGSISFSVQSNEELGQLSFSTNNSHDKNYTYSV